MREWPGLPEQATFFDLLRAVSRYTKHTRAMWPFFWLKAAAVKFDGVWHLVAFSLSGQWSDTRQALPIDPPYGALAAVSKRLDATTTWQLVKSIAATGTLELTQGIVAVVPREAISPGVMWQVRHNYVNDVAADVAEPATWWFLIAGGETMWLRDTARHNDLYRAVKPTLDALGEESFESWLSARFSRQRPPRGGFPVVSTFICHLDLPLALRVTAQTYVPQDRARRIEIDCHVPLLLRDLTVTEGDIPKSRPHAHAVARDAGSKGGWTVGHIAVSPTTGRLRIASRQLGRILDYDFSVPTREEIVAGAASYMYAPHDAAVRGAEAWKSDLLSGSDAAFEVALLNMLARFGIPVLFAGQFKTPDGQIGGTATPGFDLLALDYQGRRAVAISAKGTANLPKREQLETLRQAVQGLDRMLPNWMVIGMVACHAPQSDIANWNNKPTDLNIWGQSHLEYIFHASSIQAIAGLLWVPPWATESEKYLYPVTL